MAYFYTGEYDYDDLKDQISLQIDEYTDEPRPYIPEQYFPGQGFLPKAVVPMQYIPTGGIAKAINPLTGTQILIFGDSITTTCGITVDENNCTKRYYFFDPSNSYTDDQGNLVRFSMWPKILRDSEDCEEIRNYAYSGASFKTTERQEGNERQNLHYQIDLAINDVDNPNGAFAVDHFSPDIVIFALGTNDGVPNDDYESAMAITTIKEDGHTIDVDATIEQLSETKFCQSARKAFMRIKRAFPMAQLYCVLPIQKAFDENNAGALHDKLKQMAERYGCIIIDGTFSCGITRDGSEWNGLGAYLKDGLHPNEKGQNLMARMIITSLKQHYAPFGEGYNN
jgi:lysophospholipase L1-like esterase